MTKISSIALAALAIGAILSSNAEAQTYKLRYTPKKGDQYNYKTTMDMQQSMNAMGQDMAFNVGMNMLMQMNITNTSKTSNEMSLRFKDSKMMMKGMEAVGGTDTTMDLTMLDNVNMTFKTDSRGKVISLDKSGMETGADPALQQVNASIKQITNGFTFEYPEKAVKKGDKWTVTKKDTNASPGGSLITNSTIVYTFDGVVDTLGTKCARILAKSSAMTIEGKMQQMGMDMAIEADGATNATSYIELLNGMPVASTTSTQMDMRMAISGQENMIIPMQTDVKVAVVRVK